MPRLLRWLSWWLERRKFRKRCEAAGVCQTHLTLNKIYYGYNGSNEVCHMCNEENQGRAIREQIAHEEGRAEEARRLKEIATAQGF